MKYRILEKNNHFYPQYKTLWVWKYFLKYDSEFYVKFYFNNIDEANDYCIKHKKQNETKIHQIK